MTDKEFLDRVSIAYKCYPYPNISIEHFISWMYQQYGMVEVKGNSNERDLRGIREADGGKVS